MQKLLYGKRVTLFPFSKSDIDYFHFLLKHEGYLMGQVYFKNFESYFAYVAKEILEKRIWIWTVWSKDGKASEKIGFIALNNFTPHSVEIHGFSDKKITKGLVRLLKRQDKYTYAEDALRTIMKYAFEELKVHRIEAECFKSNLAARKLLEKAGFKREGLRVDVVKFNGNFESIFNYGLINEEGETDAIRKQRENAGCHSGSSSVRIQPIFA